MTTIRVVLLRCDDCGEIYDDGNSRTVRAALAGARGEGWERVPEWHGRNSYTWADLCGICTGKFVRVGEFTIPAK